ncbi:hypothetical protein SAMN05216436_12226 [bacterium A37T11]|nr:hypothetical protein SAMN05216436_12226 [bacterium A37T11]
MTRVVQVSGKKDLKRFIDFPHDLYRHDNNYVPELYIAQRDLLSPSHPFFEHSSIQLFLAYDGDKVTGRIAAIFNRNHNAFVGKNDGFFGFFDSIDDVVTASLLMQSAIDWVKGQGADHLIIGPVNHSTNEICGTLIENFNEPPVAMMPYNAPYYDRLLKSTGLQKRTDLRAYMVDRSTVEAKSLRVLDILKERLERNSGIVIRQINVKDFKNETVKIHDLYNKAWDKNLGFVPMTKKEFDYVAKDLKLILDPRFCLLAEQNGQLVGFALGIPDINQVQIKIKRGRLLPTGIFKLLFGRKNINTLRVLMLGVLESHRKLGIEVCLYGGIIKNAIPNSPIIRAECSWMLDENFLMNNAIEKLNGHLYKRYRLYEKML